MFIYVYIYVYMYIYIIIIITIITIIIIIIIIIIIFKKNQRQLIFILQLCLWLQARAVPWQRWTGRPKKLGEFVRQQIPNLVSVLSVRDIAAHLDALPARQPAIFLFPRKPVPVPDVYKTLAVEFEGSVSVAQVHLDGESDLRALQKLLPNPPPSLPALLFLPGSWVADTHPSPYKMRLAKAQWLPGPITMETIPLQMRRMASWSVLPMTAASFRTLCLSTGASPCVVHLADCPLVVNRSDSATSWSDPVRMLEEATSGSAHATRSPPRVAPYIVSALNTALHSSQSHAVHASATTPPRAWFGIVHATTQEGWLAVCEEVVQKGQGDAVFLHVTSSSRVLVMNGSDSSTLKVNDDALEWDMAPQLDSTRLLTVRRVFDGSEKGILFLIKHFVSRYTFCFPPPPGAACL
jgi:hypothetical protein